MTDPTVGADEPRFRFLFDGVANDNVTIQPAPDGSTLLRFGGLMLVGDRNTLIDVLTDALRQLEQEQGDR